MDKEAFLAGAFPKNAQIIFQLDDVNNSLQDIAKKGGIDAVGLFDLSGGDGILPTQWPQSNQYIGYAGGLSPDNLLQQLYAIETVCGSEIWIDAETHVRSNNDQLFDLDLVDKFLSIAEPYVITD